MASSLTIKDKITSRITIADAGHSTPCWISDRADNGNGYTVIRIDGATKYVHRIAYEEWVSPIPTGMVIDHLCRNRKCCNPTHLEPVTHRENLVRGDTRTASEVAQTHCLKGHEFTQANTYHRPDRIGRVCRTCGANRAMAKRRDTRTSRRVAATT